MWTRAAGSFPPHRRPVSAGFTLLELLMVLGIMGMLLGLGIAAYIGFRRRMGELAEVRQLEVVIADARHRAITQEAFGTVRIDRLNKTFRALGYQVVGQWHFEGRGISAAEAKSLGLPAEELAVAGGAYVEGKVGQAISFESSDGAYAEPPKATCKLFEPTEGIYVECYVYPRALGTGGATQTIFQKKDNYSLALDESGRLVATAGQGGRLQVNSGCFRLRNYQWYKVAFTFDHYQSQILVEGAVVARGPGLVFAYREIKPSPLTFSAPSGGFIGYIDEARVLTLVRGRTLSFPTRKDVTIAADGGPFDAIYFNAAGQLDPRYHSGPVRVSFLRDREAEGRIVNYLTIGWTGQIVERGKHRLPPEELEEDTSGDALWRYVRRPGAKKAAPPRGSESRPPKSAEPDIPAEPPDSAGDEPPDLEGLERAPDGQ